MAGDAMLSLLHSETRYTCPGDPHPISESIHQARLRSGWSGCLECQWNEAPSGDDLADRSFVIRRTRHGVRGAWLNAIDRKSGAQLACLFSEQLRRLSCHQSEVSDRVTNTESTKVALGFDAQLGCTEIFAAALTAVRQRGIHVVDAGRCTSASLLHVFESFPDLNGVILITGQEGRSGETGIDAFLPDGSSLSVPWQELGVKVQNPAGHLYEGSEVDAWKQRLSLVDHSSRQPAPGEAGLQLLIPAGMCITRGGRTAGRHLNTNAETSYRNHLTRWWPGNPIHGGTVFLTDNRLTKERLVWLARNTGQNIRVLSSESASDLQFRTGVCFRIGADDRRLEVVNRKGRPLAAEEVSTWVNESYRTENRHVTSHVSPDNEVVLVDVAQPDSARQYRFMTDALATAGFILGLLTDSRNRLPG